MRRTSNILKTINDKKELIECIKSSNFCHLKFIEINSYSNFTYKLLHRYQRILVECNIQVERACEFSFNIAQSQFFVVLTQSLFHSVANKLLSHSTMILSRNNQYITCDNSTLMQFLSQIILRYKGQRVRQINYRETF